MNRYERRVRGGAEYLDSRGSTYADWRDRLDLGTLDVDDDRRCVIGQLRRSFNTSPEFWRSNRWLRDRGFVVSGVNWFGVVIGWRGTRRFDRRNLRLAEAWRSYVLAERMKAREQVR